MRREDFDAESAVLACLLRDGQAYWRIADFLSCDDFTNAGNQRLFRTLQQEITAGRPTDAVTIGELDGGLATLALDIDSTSIGNPRFIRSYADLVSKRQLLRRLRAAGRMIANLEPDEDVFGEAQRILASCAPRITSGGPKHISAFVRQSMRGLTDRAHSDRDLTGVPTGYAPLDDLTGGWQPTDLIIIAARPSVGKSAFSLQSILHGTRPKEGVNGFMASLEMSGEQLADRAISHIGRINAVHIRRPKLMEEDEWDRSAPAAKTLMEHSLFIDESSGLNVEGISARARQLHSENPLGLIAIDYLTYIDLPRRETTEQGIQHVTRSLKGLAKELRVPVILLSQLNRDGDDEPSLKHLRGSGAIEQDADVVIFLHRPDKSRRDVVKVKVEKQRNGALGEFYLNAMMERQRFEPMDWNPPAAPERKTLRSVGAARQPNLRKNWQERDDE
ncbi:replicative DNA helicase [Stenotrophomonas maltophilia]|uniref:replicative DNA helicase n=1 Tax=Stenotrophomonas maltophilia TaxID=40324 RepID=UPI0013DCB042|nr:DnaB-like helicase C-terminal domain-containing protein [Stenotrophomonas maltophilia]